MSKLLLRKGNMVVVDNKLGVGWRADDGTYSLQWLPSMNRFNDGRYVVTCALRLTGAGAAATLIECEQGELVLLRCRPPNDGVLCDDATRAPYLFPTAWLRVCEEISPAAKPEPKPEENLMCGIRPANYTPRHPIYKWTGPVPWDPEGE